MATMTDIAALVEIDPNYMGGWPVITGTGVPVIRVANATMDAGQSADEVAADWDLTLEQVHAALAYYYANREQIDCEVAAASEEGERIAGEAPSRLRVL